MNDKIGIRDVAALAGVSLGTVSNVLNGLPSVSARNVERVQAAMSELGFVPNAHARNLRSQRTATIGLLVLNIANPFFAEVAHEAQVMAEQNGSTLVIASSDQDRAREDRYLRMFEESRARALIVAPVDGASRLLREVHDRGTPVVLMDEHVDAAEFSSVSMDGSAGGLVAGEHLIAIGRRRLAFVGGPLIQVADRASGIGGVVSAHPGAILTMFETPDLTIDEGRRAARRIAALPETTRPDGVFAANDLVALGLLREFAELGIRVPDDIAVIGYDDIDWGRTAPIPLTSVRQPRERIGAEAIRLILDEEAGRHDGKQHEQVRLAPELVIRASTVA